MSDIAKISAALGEPFPRSAHKTRRGGGGKDLTYIEGHTVIHRLNDATGNQWDLRVVSLDSFALGTRTLLRAHVALTIPGLGTREHIGVQEVAERGGEDLIKGAVTDALKKAATLFGVGLELFGPDYEAGEITDAPPRNRSTTRNTAPDLSGAPQTHDTGAQASEHPANVQRASQGQINVVKKHLADLGWGDAELSLVVQSKNRAALADFTADEAANLIKFLGKPETAKSWLNTMKPAQAAMLPNADAAERARH